jgi:hypothetical protein
MSQLDVLLCIASLGSGEDILRRVMAVIGQVHLRWRGPNSDHNILSLSPSVLSPSVLNPSVVSPSVVSFSPDRIENAILILYNFGADLTAEIVIVHTVAVLIA